MDRAPGRFMRRNSGPLLEREKLISWSTRTNERGMGVLRERQMELYTDEGAEGQEQAVCDSQRRRAIPSLKPAPIYHFITSSEERSLYFLYQHI